MLTAVSKQDKIQFRPELYIAFADDASSEAKIRNSVYFLLISFVKTYTFVILCVNNHVMDPIFLTTYVPKSKALEPLIT